jgi:Ca2+-binding EF-hand superfamily protein
VLTKSSSDSISVPLILEYFLTKMSWSLVQYCNGTESVAQVIFYWNLVIRHLTRHFMNHPNQPPPAPPPGTLESDHKIALSDGQASQIKEIFDLFDTDGGGTIDRRELDFAMVALGFQKQKRVIREVKLGRMGVLDTIVQDGKVTLKEFSALMTGELSGRDPVQTLGSMFVVLSGDGGSRRITLPSLTAACNYYEVSPLAHHC